MLVMFPSQTLTFKKYVPKETSNTPLGYQPNNQILLSPLYGQGNGHWEDSVKQCDASLTNGHCIM
jgi:hypothetical protein